MTLHTALPDERTGPGAGAPPTELPSPGASPAAIDPALLALLRDRVRASSGLAVPPDTLERALRQRLARRQLDPATYAARLTPTELQQLLELLVVPESWLFRDPGAFAAAVRAVQATLANGAASVRLLVLPCAAGEEAYSLAIALAEAGIAPAQWQMDAVDLSAAALVRARTGWFGPNAFRGADLAFRARHFTPDGAGWRIDPALQRGIQFQRGNLLTWPGVAGGYDVLFCRNLLIYFDEPTAAAALARLRALLAPDGVLCAGYAEVPAFCAAGFAPLPLPAAFALRHADAPEPAWVGTLGDRRASPRAPDRRQPPRRAPYSGRVPTGASPAAVSGAVPGSPPPFGGPSSALDAPSAPAEPGKPPRAAMVPGRSAPPAPSGTAPGAPAEATQAAPPRGGADAPDAADLLAAARQQADRGDLPAAAALCRRVIAAAPATAEAYYLLAVAAAHAGDADAARAELRRCLYLDPDHYACLCQLALLAEQDGDDAAATRLRRRAARVHARETP